MAADLHIHIYKGLTEDDMWLFFQNHIGSKWDEMTKMWETIEKEYGSIEKAPKKVFQERFYQTEEMVEKKSEKIKAEIKKEGWHDYWEKVGDTPNIWVGEVSWLKAGLLEDNETFIPDTVAEVERIIGEDLPIIDDELINKIADAMKLPNKTSYSLENAETAIAFLKAYKGEKAFTISW